MLIESATATPRVGPAAGVAAAGAGRDRTAGQITERVALVGLALVVIGWAFAPFVITAIDAAQRHRVFLGVSGQYPMDGLQYLAWARDAGHGLIRNLFGSAADSAVFVHPIWSPTGWVQAWSGVSAAAIMAFWKAVSCVALAAGCARLVTWQIPSVQPGRRRVAFALALFGGLTPVSGLLPLIDHAQLGTDFARAAGDLIPAASLWDYVPLAVALGAMPFAVRGLAALVAGSRDRRTVVRSAALGLLITWLHPWQGETLVALAAGLVVWQWLEDRRASAVRRPGMGPRDLVALAWVLAAIAVPLLYYLILSTTDSGWAVSERASVVAAHVPLPVIVACVLPLLMIGAIAGRRLAGDRSARPLLLWPLATLLVVAVTPSGQYRALDGLTLPIAVLAVRAWPAVRPTMRGALPAVMAAACLLVPAGVYAIGSIGRLQSRSITRYTELTSSDVRAASVAAREAQGRPILAPVALGTAIPALVDTPTWDGHPIWTPEHAMREFQTSALFGGELAPAQMRALVRAIGSRALVAPCGSPARLGPALAPLGFRQQDVGCARVYSLR